MQIMISFVLTIMLGSCVTTASTISVSPDVNEQINKTVPLAPGSDVKVSSINGKVSIETADINQAEIDIKITASDREAMERRPLVVENTPNSLTIRVINDREGKNWGWERGWVRHDVRLRLPRNINLRIGSVNGPVNVGQITGTVSLGSINGRVDVAQAGTATEISSINGHTTISLTRIGEGGLRVSSINGGVEIGLPSGVNAEVDVRSVNGGVDTDLPITVIGEMKRGQLRGTIGSGGPSITITSVNGGVLLRRI